MVKKLILLTVVTAVTVATLFFGCGGGSSSPATSTTRTATGSLGTASGSVSAGHSLLKSADYGCAGNICKIIATDTSGGTVVDDDLASCAFSLPLVIGKSYAISFVDCNDTFVGTLISGTSIFSIASGSTEIAFGTITCASGTCTPSTGWANYWDRDGDGTVGADDADDCGSYSSEDCYSCEISGYSDSDDDGICDGFEGDSWGNGWASDTACDSDDDCESGETCQAYGYCDTANNGAGAVCTTSSDCSSDTICWYNTCADPTEIDIDLSSTCTSDSDCDEGEACWQLDARDCSSSYCSGLAYLAGAPASSDACLAGSGAWWCGQTCLPADVAECSGTGSVEYNGELCQEPSESQCVPAEEDDGAFTGTWEPNEEDTCDSSTNTACLVDGNEYELSEENNTTILTIPGDGTCSASGLPQGFSTENCTITGDGGSGTELGVDLLSAGENLCHMHIVKQ